MFMKTGRHHGLRLSRLAAQRCSSKPPQGLVTQGRRTFRSWRVQKSIPDPCWPEHKGQENLP